MAIHHECRNQHDAAGCRKTQTLCPLPVNVSQVSWIKKGQSREKAPDLQEMGTLRCDGCGEEFLISHHPTSVNKWIAEKQAKWLEKVLAEEHERDKKTPPPNRTARLICTSPSRDQIMDRKSTIHRERSRHASVSFVWA